MSRLLQLIFGCRHRRRSFPITIKGHTYICCLSCGRQWNYDFTAMRVTSLKGLTK